MSSKGTVVGTIRIMGNKKFVDEITQYIELMLVDLGFVIKKKTYSMYKDKERRVEDEKRKRVYITVYIPK